MSPATITSDQPKGGAKSFFLTYILPALVSAVFAAITAFGASYLSVRDGLAEVSREVKSASRETGELKAAQEKLATKEAEALKDTAIGNALHQVDQRMGRIEETQKQILLLLSSRNESSRR